MIESIMREQLITDPTFIGTLTGRIVADRETALRDKCDIDMPLRVVDIRAFRPGCDCTECSVHNIIGEIDVQYSTRGWQAVYGFTAAGDVTCYMD